MKRRITLFDTSIYSENLGDFIIMEAVVREMSPLLGKHQTITIPTHANIGRRGRALFKESEFSLVCGTNILTSNVFKYRQWKFKWSDLISLNHAILVGVGWWKYQHPPTWLTGLAYKRILSSTYQHSVRDEHTRNMLSTVGITNVINTGCATMWALSEEHCQQINHQKSPNVVFTLTDYRKDIEKDTSLITTLLDYYEKVYFWPQGIGDMDYIQELGDFGSKIHHLPGNIISFNNCLMNNDVDYVGTRLHGGIRALQLKRRSIIIGVDNRAKEKSASFNIPYVDRTDKESLLEKINGSFETKISLPLQAIHDFKAQFNSL